MLLYILLKSYAVDILHYNILKLLTEADVVHLNNIRMRKQGYSLALVLKSSYEVIVSKKFVLKYFYCDNSVINVVVCLVNNGHSANTDNFLNFISAVKAFANIIIHLINLSDYFDMITTVILSPPPFLLALFTRRSANAYCLPSLIISIISSFET